MRTFYLQIVGKYIILAPSLQTAINEQAFLDLCFLLYVRIGKGTINHSLTGTLTRFTAAIRGPAFWHVHSL